MAVLSIRNNNPGNIRDNGIPWQGRIGSGSGFVKFSSPEYGVRAMTKNLYTYQNRGLTSVRDMISRWAPPNENDTNGYVNFVANRMGIDPNASIDLRSNPALTEKMVGAMIAMEGGPSASDYFDSHIAGGIALANGASVPNIPPVEEVDPDSLTDDDTDGSQDDTDGVAQPERDRRRSNPSVPQYIENVLNKYDSYTYNWTIYMVHPYNAHKDPASLTESDQTIILSQTGVDDEISLQTVIQDLALSFHHENRNGMANNFAVTFLEPGGFTMFNRIVYAAKQLGIENHLDACYIMKLDFVGWAGERAVTDPVGPYYYTTRLMGLTFDFKDGASTYYGNFVETKEDAFNRLELHTKNDITIDNVATFGAFLSELEEEFNNQLIEQLANQPNQMFHDKYVFKTSENWGSFRFDAVNTDALATTAGISVTGDGNLSITIPMGTALNSAMVLALFQTTEFKKILTNQGGFAKQDPDDGEADPIKLAELTKWVKVSSNVRYMSGRYDVLSKRYAKEITYDVNSIIAANAVHDPVSFQELHTQPKLQRDRLREIFANNLLKKRFDYTFTGRNTEVLDLTVKLDSAYYAIQALNSGALSHRETLFVGSSADGQKRNNELKQKSDKLAKEIAQLQRERQAKQRELDSIDTSTGGPRGASAEAKASIVQSEIAALDERIRVLEPQAESARAAWEEDYRRLDSELDTSTVDLGRASNRYITQSDLYGGRTTSNNESLPTTFEYSVVNSLANGGPEKPNDDIGSSMLGAMELNLNSIADLMQQQIFVRGDPYWLGQNETDFEIGGPYYFLNMNFPTYPDENTGLIESLSSTRADGNFTITGLYIVTQVQARYEEGQFTMMLAAHRDTNTNSQLLFNDLDKGYVE